ncbi:hypothetical protein I7I53_00222 [Histoplasma capsulatum var. duboisii H88]|uniref:Uncharacterized protein n=1 Tax=Ajellomyces capsulatus (strain H88) TaxID=544711 RepID=A0A8A1LKT8_AJEC8|nr:hypothetical protein I7I53_00222 [Histoplasma capsulatum var. duboisii H88]
MGMRLHSPFRPPHARLSSRRALLRSPRHRMNPSSAACRDIDTRSLVVRPGLYILSLLPRRFLLQWHYPPVHTPRETACKTLMKENDPRLP